MAEPSNISFKTEFVQLEWINKPNQERTSQKIQFQPLVTLERQIRECKANIERLKKGEELIERDSWSKNFRYQQENTSIRVSNIPDVGFEEQDLKELFRPFGDILRIYLAKHVTGENKGFAYIRFNSKESALEAIRATNNRKFGMVILSVEWADPPKDKREIVKSRKKKLGGKMWVAPNSLI